MTMKTISHSPRYNYLSREQQDRIHQTSLEILETVGAYIYDRDSIELFKKGGARVENDGKVFIPRAMVEKAVASAPKEVPLFTREGEEALMLAPGNVYFGPGSDCLYIHDHRTGERRPGMLKDVEELARLCDALPNIDFLMSGLVPSDITPAQANLFQMNAMLEGSSKPIMFVTNDFESSLGVVAAAEVVTGGEKELRARPPICCYINVTDPLRHNGEALQKLLFLGKKGIPATYTPVVLRGVNGPVTTAGATALANAGELVGLVLSQLNQEGAPLILSGGYGDVFDMSSMTGLYTGPESFGPRPSMASYYGMPVFGLGGASDSKIPDEQAAIEASLSLFCETLGDVNLVHDVGFLEEGKCFSFELLALCDEMIGYIRRYTGGIEVSDETLALDVIKEQGQYGEYLGTDHTVEHFRDDWHPAIFDRNSYTGWQAAGARTAAERARERVSSLLKSHRPVPLEPEKKKQIAGILLDPQ